jgi:hypothetical protein
MIEVPVIILVAFAVMSTFIGFTFGRTVDLLTRDGRRKRVLSRVTPVWEVHVGSNGRDYGYGIYDTGEYVVVSVRKVRRSGKHFELLQKIEVARVRGESDPDEILRAVDRANALVNTLALTGVA